MGYNLGAAGVEGLSEGEVIARRERGQGNVIQFQTGRTYLQIVRKNAFTSINTVLFSIGIVLILMGQFGDALMQSGSQATRGVADIVLLGDSFAALPIAFREGQRIVKGMEDVVRLLLTRTFYVLLLIVATQLVGVPFPVTPKHNSILALLTVGIPILAIAAWARPGAPPRSVVRSTSLFCFRRPLPCLWWRWPSTWPIWRRPVTWGSPVRR
jgi:hypothetical protein